MYDLSLAVPKFESKMYSDMKLKLRASYIQLQTVFIILFQAPFTYSGLK